MKLNDNLSFSRYEWIPAELASLLTQSPSKLVWDVGAGEGMMQAPVEAAGGVYRGFDLNPLKTEIERWDLDDAPAKDWGSAGGAILMDVIEHCNNPGLALRHISSGLAPGAFLILTMPNPRWSRSRFYALAFGTAICFTQADLDGNHHVFTPWPHILEKLLADAGFEVQRQVTLDGRTEWPGAPMTPRYPVRLLLAAAMKALENFDPSARGMSYGIVARKVS